MLKIGVIGTGHLGNIHIKLLKEIAEWEVVGIYDTDWEKSQSIANKFSVKAYEDVNQLLMDVDAIDIVTPTPFHFEYAMQAIEMGKHFFVEKPITQSVEQGRQVLAAATEHKIIGQVGHVERFNPAFLAVQDKIAQPLFIETHRLAQFNPRGTDVSVVLDLMIHDLDILLKMVQSEVVDIQASGVALLSKEADIVNARIRFANACVANVTASRLSTKNMRKMRLFQASEYISIDFLQKKSEIVRLSDEVTSAINAFPMELADGAIKYLTFEVPESPDVNAIKMELSCFADSIANQTPVRVSLGEAVAALDLAYQINEIVEQTIEAQKLVS